MSDMCPRHVTDESVYIKSASGGGERHMKAIRLGLLNTSAAMVALLWSVQAPAQAVTDTKRKASEPDAIIVTAQKREQAIQDIPASVSSLGTKALEQRGIRDV